MKSEILNNIRTFCSEHAPKPNKNLRSWNPEKFIGNFVKVAFEIKGNPPFTKEHMWVKIMMVTRDGLLGGHLANTPLFTDEMKFGDKITIRVEQIEDFTTY